MKNKQQSRRWARIVPAALSGVALLVSGCAVLPWPIRDTNLPPQVMRTCQVVKFYETKVQNGAVEIADDIRDIVRKDWKLNHSSGGNRGTPYVGHWRSVWGRERLVIEQKIKFPVVDKVDDAQIAQIRSQVAEAMRKRGWAIVKREGSSLHAEDSTRRAIIGVGLKGDFSVNVSMKPEYDYDIADDYYYKNLDKAEKCQIPGMKMLPGIPGASRQ